MHTELVDAAAAFDPPIRLELMPAVAVRRREEAEQVKREAARAEREAPVNQQHEEAVGRTGRSVYLDALHQRRS